MSKAEDFAYSKYHQAEKDLELTWNDMAETVKIANILEIEWLNSTPWDGIRDWGFYTEVLKRFKAQKSTTHKLKICGFHCKVYDNISNLKIL